MMTSPVAGIDPHQDSITVGIVDPNGVELTHEAFPASAAGYLAAVELLTTHRVQAVGVEGSAGWGSHVSIALVAAGFDCREVPAQRSAAQRRSRRLDKTDAVDAVAAARALLAEPSLGPVQTLEVYDPLVAKIEAVLEHRRMLVAVRTLVLHHAQDQISKLPVEIRDQLSTVGKIEGRLRRLEDIDMSFVSTSLASIDCHGCCPSSTRTVTHVAKSALWSTTSIGSSMSTALRYVTSPASDRSSRRRCWPRLATHSGSPASPNSLAGAAPERSLSRPVRAPESQ